jgi:hypothetical protein
MLPCMRKALTLTLSVALLGIFAAVVVAAMEPSDGTSTLPASSTGTTEDRTTTTSTSGVDISGPCDEAEHANDPRCTGVPARPSAPALPAGAGVDISGPCDEAEHANDPRCTGAGVPGEAGRVDNSGPGSVNAGDDEKFDDHGGDDFDDHGADDFGVDSSGSGHGGDENSGHGGGDD